MTATAIAPKSKSRVNRWKRHTEMTARLIEHAIGTVSFTSDQAYTAVKTLFQHHTVSPSAIRGAIAYLRGQGKIRILTRVKPEGAYAWRSLYKFSR